MITDVTRDTVDRAVEMNVPFRVHEGGAIESPLMTVDTPHAWHVEGASAPDDVEVDARGDWRTWSDGYTGQYSYSGAVMHASEFLGGRMADDLLAEPGVYCCVPVEVMPTEDDEEPEPAGWAVLRLAP